MAQPELDLEEESLEKETEELERLLEDAQESGDELPESGPEERETSSSKKKIFIFAGIGTLLLLLLGGGAWYLFFSKNPEPNENADEALSQPLPETEIEPALKPIAKVNIYPLAPFFLPLRNDGRETGRFISVAPNLILSNSTLQKEIEKTCQR